MKNTLIIEVDTDKENPISIIKPNEEITDENLKKEMVINDVVSTFEALCVLIQHSHENNYIIKKETIDNFKNRLEELK
jgi:hypothetical protein